MSTRFPSLLRFPPQCAPAGGRGQRSGPRTVRTGEGRPPRRVMESGENPAIQCEPIHPTFGGAVAENG
jgi:hypothetical protein